MTRSLYGTVLILLACTLAASAQDRAYGRSMVETDQGIATTSQYLASQTGAKILAEGGSAVDAAIAANAVLGVTEPMMNGIGGDLFLIYWDAKTGKLYGLNASGWSPEKLTIAYLESKGITGHMPEHGIQSVTVPGCVAGWWAAHQRFGRLPWKDLFTDAIYYAQHGYAVPEIIDDYWHIGRRTLQQSAYAQKIYLPGGKVPAQGEIFRNPDLAHALQLIADRGPDAFYKGSIAHAILQASNALGGTMQEKDLADYRPEWVTPVSLNYRGWQVYELPPNSQGVAALEMLGIMSHSKPDPKGPESATELYKKIEAMKLAYSDLYRYDGDPRFTQVPVAGLLSSAYTASRAAKINSQHADCSPPPGVPPKSDTTYLATIDADGNIASMIESNYDYFGSGVGVPGMGFVLQDRGALFRLQPGLPDALAPHKRPFHTLMPAFMQRGDIHIGFGIMGGSNQPLAHAQFVSNVADYNYNIQAALSAPRFTVPDNGRITCDVLIESRVTPDVRAALQAKGEILHVRNLYSATMGRGAAVEFNTATGLKEGASDPRADGDAVPQPPPTPAEAQPAGVGEKR